MTSYLFTLKSTNAKTGPMPVTTTSKDSCPTTCPFMGHGCYADSGRVGMLWTKMTAAGPNASFANGRSTVRTLSEAELLERIKALLPGAIWRDNQAGDQVSRAGKIDRAALERKVKANLGKRGFTYTHHNALQDKDNAAAIQHANQNGFTINLSGNTLAHADKLADLAIAPVVVVLPKTVHGHIKLDTPKGRRVVVCPATYRDDVSCLTCQLCQRRDRKVIVGFPAHGASAGKADIVANQ